MYNQDWDIKPRSKACWQCQYPFADQQPYISYLVFGKDGYDRFDYCDVCWAQRMVDGKAISVWKGIFRAPPPEPEEPIKKETAESLLRKLIEDNDLSKKNLIFILAVMLERRRILIERDVQAGEDGSRIRVYEHRNTGDTFVITDPMLHLDQIEQVQKEVVAMLSGDSKQPGYDHAGSEDNGGNDS